MARRTTIAWLAWLTAVAWSSTAQSVEVAGSEATFQWAASSGPVSGYYVIVSRDAGPAQVEAVTLEAQETLQGDTGETLVVQVAAFGSDGVAGPVSDPSDPITFVVDDGSGSGGSGGDGSGSGGDGGGSSGGGDGGGDGSGGGSSGGDANPAILRDFDGDGLSDLLLRTATSLRIWAMNGASVGREIQLPSVPANSRLVGMGDYDGNGTADLLWALQDSDALLLWRLGGGVLLGTVDLVTGLPGQEDWIVGGTGDFDGDGLDDVALFSRSAGAVEIWQLDGEGQLAARTSMTGHTGSVSLKVDDVDGDGLAELVWLDETGRALHLQDPDAGSSVALGDVENGWTVRTAIDLDGDGARELLMHHATSGAVQQWTVDGSGVIDATELPNAATMGVFVSSGDFDGDGLEDAAWSPSGSKTVMLWLAGAAEVAEVDLGLPSDGQLLSDQSGVNSMTVGACAVASGGFDATDYDRDGDTDTNDFIDGFLPAFNQPQPFPSAADHDCDGDTDIVDFLDHFMPVYQGS